jgi:L-ascorbate metabolism protein UlaG (beta-lactamase superfamily)
MAVTLDWLGCATFRLTVDDLVIFLDAYIDRVPSAPPVGLTTAEVRRADYILVGHSHFDHLWGAERIARNTGATVIGSHETVRLMVEEEVPEEQLVFTAGGDRIRLSDDVFVRVYPSQHSCIWATTDRPDAVCLGDMGLTWTERQASLAARAAARLSDDRPGMAEARAHRAANRQRPRGEGGALAYLIETPYGSIFWKDTSGHWTGILRDIRPDVAILAAAGRGNIDGEPVQGTLAQFMAREADLLRPRRIVLSHHDDWFPPTTSPPDATNAAVREELGRQQPHIELVEMGYSEGIPILQGLSGGRL